MNDPLAETRQKQLPALVSGAAVRGIVPTSFEEVQRIANTAVEAGTLGYFKDDDGRRRLIAQGCLIIMQGLELGLSPMQSFNGIAVINGKTLIYGKLARARIIAAGHKIEERIEDKGTDKETFYCKITRKDSSITKEVGFSRNDAIQAGLWSPEPKIKKMVWDNAKKVEKLVDNDSTWHKYPSRMMGWRAFGHCATDVCSDALLGLDLVEIMQDVKPVEEDRGTLAPVPPPPAEALSTAPLTKEELAEAEEIEEALVEVGWPGVDAAEAAKAEERPGPNMRSAIGDLAARMSVVKTMEEAADLIEDFHERYDGYISEGVKRELGQIHENVDKRLAGMKNLERKQEKK